jgi:hypothetical protein
VGDLGRNASPYRAGGASPKSPKRIKAVKVWKKGCSWGISINFHRAEGTFFYILYLLFVLIT